ncbi:Unspecific monooxygenase protein [Dioscorea alata]|uniref:Unspecific monooxygenase protein n=1 Tax=Dioscorea alata TaxID=55571 RepID=A0ACB7U3I5_DIOAL|nr:Unspecific monooxygenase protein [Dioscorea alata]
MESCDAAVPFILLWSLIRTGGSSPAVSSSCPDAARSRFLKDYISRFTNAFLWVALISVTVLLARKLARLVRLWNLGSRIPGPPAPSFFGYLKGFSSLGSDGNLTGYLAKLHAKYGPIVRLWLGPTQLLVSVRETSMIEEVLVKAKDKLPLTRRAFRLAFGRSRLFASSFEEVHKRRESLAACLNGMLLDRVNTVAPKVVKCVMGRIDSIMAKGVLDCRSISQHMAFALFGTTLFGDAFLSWSDAIFYEEILMLIAKDACFWASYNVPPVWRRCFWTYQSLCKEAKQLTLDIIQHSKSYAERNETVDATSLLDDEISNKFLLEEIVGHHGSEDEHCGDILGMMFHGCLATAGLIWSILTRLSLYPELLEKMYSEIDRVQNGSSNPEIYDVRNMHFLLATVYESARLLPAGSLLQRCSVNCDLRLETGITVPAGAIIVVPPELVHLDNSIWGKEACQFNPNRFLSKVLCHGHSCVGGKPDPVSVTSLEGTSQDCQESEETTFRFNAPNKNMFLSFGSGTRACVGQEFTVLGISTLLAALLQEYEVRIQACAENSPKPAAEDFLLHHLPNTKIFFVKRNRS